MRLITWNIQWGLGIDGVFDLARVVAHAKAMADFDVLCLQEVADNLPDLTGSSGENQFAEFARLLPDYHAIDAVAVDVPGATGGRRRFGNMVLSRLPVGQILRYTLPWETDDTPNMPRALIDAVVTAPFGALRVMTTHLEYSSSKLRAAQVEGIREAHRTASARVAQPPRESYGPFIPQARSRPAILTGDFNMPASDPIKLRIEAPLAGAPAFRDAWMTANPGAPHPPSFCLFDQRYGEPHCCDFVFVTEDLLPRLKRVHYDTDTKVSDHQPVLVELDDA